MMVTRPRTITHLTRGPAFVHGLLTGANSANRFQAQYACSAVGDITPRRRIRKPASVRGWLSPAEAAELLQVDRSTVRRWIHEGELPAIRTRPGGGQFRLDPADIERFAAARQVRPTIKEDRPRQTNTLTD